jgi:hypothetical protein
VITGVRRRDLVEYLTPEQIGRFDDADMQRLAEKMTDAYLNQVFWIDLEILAHVVRDEGEH